MKKAPLHHRHDSEHTTSCLWASISSFWSWLSPAEGLAALESYHPRARSLGTLNGHMVLRRQHMAHALPRGLHLLCESPRQPFQGTHRKNMAWKHALSLSRLHFIHFRVHCFVLVCYRQKAHLEDTWHFPGGQNDPKYSTFLAKLEFSPIIPRDKKNFTAQRPSLLILNWFL